MRTKLSLSLRPRPSRLWLTFSSACFTASENHTVVLTSEGTVLTWGSDRFGQLGHGGKEKGPCLLPRRVEALRRVVVKDISAGSMHTAAISSTGEVYTWGSNKSGQLGYEGAGEGTPKIVSHLYYRHSAGKDPRRAIQVSARASSPTPAFPLAEAALPLRRPPHDWTRWRHISSSTTHARL